MVARIAFLIILLISPASLIAQVLKIMTYNIRFDNPSDGVNAWPNRKSKVFDLIKKYDPDVIGVQEALLHQIQDIVVALPEYDFIGVGRDDGKTKGEFSAILYKKKKMTVAENSTFWLSKTPDVPGSKDWDAAITRVATWGKFKDVESKKEFYLINTHFDHIGKEARKNSAVLLRQKANEMTGIPIIITGDFNCTRADDPYKVMVEKNGVQLHDPAIANAPGTYCTFTVNGPECTPIDHIFHTSDWNVSDYKVITDNDGKHYPSDHLPVMVIAKLKE